MNHAKSGMLRRSRFLILITLTVVCLGFRAEASELFPRPASLEPNVRFWVDVFTAYSYRDFIIHDRDKVWKVYQVLRMPGDGIPTQEDVEWANDYLKNRYRTALMHLSTGAPPSDYIERDIVKLFRGEPLKAYAAAADNLRVQQGLKERFRETLVRARGYQPVMERIFRAAGLPIELTLIPSVESGFYTRARSSAGAVGIWQFTRSTGRQYLTIRGRRDDRLDPVRSTAAAAKLLNYNYSVLGTWPLAVTAYNHGTWGMQKATEVYGDDFPKIVERYDGPHFGFASKNYYAEFLAALQVHQYEDKYFPGIKDEVAPPMPKREPVVRTASLDSGKHGQHHAHRATAVKTHHQHRHRHTQRVVLRNTGTRRASKQRT